MYLECQRFKPKSNQVQILIRSNKWCQEFHSEAQNHLTVSAMAAKIARTLDRKLRVNFKGKKIFLLSYPSFTLLENINVKENMLVLWLASICHFPSKNSLREQVQITKLNTRNRRMRMRVSLRLRPKLRNPTASFRTKTRNLKNKNGILNQTFLEKI